MRVRVYLFPLSTLMLSEQPRGEPSETVQATAGGLRDQTAVGGGGGLTPSRPGAHCECVLAECRHSAAALTWDFFVCVFLWTRPESHGECVCPE